MGRICPRPFAQPPKGEATALKILEFEHGLHINQPVAPRRPLRWPEWMQHELREPKRWLRRGAHFL